MTISARSILAVSAGDGYEQKASTAKTMGDSQSAVPFARMMEQNVAKGYGEQSSNVKSFVQSEKISSDQTAQSQQKEAYHSFSDSQKNTDTKSVLQEDSVDAAVKSVNEISQSIKEVVMEETGLSEEDLEQAMEALGATYLDLLNPQMLSQLVASVEEAAAEGGVMMDSALFTEELLPLIEEAATEVLADNGISLEDFQEFLSEADQGELELPEDIVKLLPSKDTAADTIVDPTSDTAEIVVQPVDSDTTGSPYIDQGTASVLKSQVGQTVEIIHITDEELFQTEMELSNPVEGIAGSLSGQVEVSAEGLGEALAEEGLISEPGLMGEENAITDIEGDGLERTPGLSGNTVLDGFMSETPQDDSGESFSGESGRNGQMNMGRTEMFQEMMPNQNLAAESTQNTFAQTLQEVSTPLESYTSAQTSDIINQIVSSASTTLSETVSRMEMELNPQNLGRMIMQVQQEGDTVTARLIAQNENVKNALETQMMQLRQSLEVKGIKVDAVEVSVGTHEFEQNLEEGMSQQFAESQEERQAENAGRRMRNLNRDELEDLADELTEEEELAAAIMRDQGGTVDYSA